MNLFAKKITLFKKYESYTQTHDKSKTLEYVFWSALPESIQDRKPIGGNALYNVFEYTYRAVKQVYKKECSE